jgi:glycosyltransferase involved in cell wall biosynthesis
MPPDDGEALAAAIQGLIDHPRMRVKLGKRALARAAGFTIDRTADAYVHVYESLIAV